MSVKMAKTMKEIHPDSILLFKQGTFYHAYGKDALILLYYFDYKIKTVEKNVPTCGFPQNAINRVSAKLEREKINYITVDVKNDNDIVNQEDFKNLNRFEEVLEIAKKIVNLKRRIYAIESYLLDEIKSENIHKKIIEIENILYEN